MYLCPYANYFFFRSPAPSYSITINRNTKKLTLYRNGKIYRTYPVAIGKSRTPTPSGIFRIINKQINPGGPYGVRWMGLSANGIGIHGTNNPASIGKAVSNGCIRMYNKDVIELFNIVSMGTIVKII
ncbi:L,D-transpeptidase [Clostridium sp.]|uniref:L,D-transpeptidase n=1 Tax=Clostridium sp. TaxID=1506 RepID=UPI002FDDB264